MNPQQYEHSSYGRNRWRLVYTCLPVTVLILGLAGLLAYRQSQLSDVPDIGEPFDLATWGRIDIDPSQNAQAEYQAAYDRLVATSEPEYEELNLITEGTWQDATPQVHQWLDDNLSALDIWREGTSREYMLRVQPADLTLGSFGPISEARTLTRLSQLAARRAEYVGDFDGAWQWHRARFRFSRHLGMFDTSIDRAVGAACHALAVDGIVRWAGEPGVGADQLASALAHLKNDDEMTAPVSVAIRAEYFLTLDGLNRLDEQRGAEKHVYETLGISGPKIPNDAALFFTSDPEFTRRLLAHQVRNLLAFVDLPVDQRHPTLPGDIAYYDVVSSGESPWLDPAAFQDTVSRSSLARTQLLKFSGGSAYLTRERLRQTLLEVTLAAERYRRENEAFPETLDDLVTVGTLDEIPIDPLSPSSAAISYERDPDNVQRAKVWSVGRDQIDDDGDFNHVPGDGPADVGYLIGDRPNS